MAAAANFNIIQQIPGDGFVGVPNTIINPPGNYSRIGRNDNWDTVQEKQERNRARNSQKRAFNQTLIQDDTLQWILLANAETGRRPPGCPNSKRKVLLLDHDDWYDIGDEMGYPQWRREQATLGRCRREWCADHGVDVLTMAEKLAL